MSRTDLPIGVFDSGIGGLTVLRALQNALPNEHLLYLGDTARAPYGPRSAQTVRHFSLDMANHLVGRGVKALVVACNTITTWALDILQAAAAPLGIPVIGVIEASADRAVQVTKTGSIAVIATNGTVRSGAYPRALLRRQPDLVVAQQACALFVALAEEGWTDGDIANLVADRYLAPLRQGPRPADALILGCTHFPLLSDAIQNALPNVTLVDSLSATAAAVERRLASARLLRTSAGPARYHFLVTDRLDRFLPLGERILGVPPTPAEVVDLTADETVLTHPLTLTEVEP